MFVCFCFQLVDKLNTNTEMEEMINNYNIVSSPTWSNLCAYFTCLEPEKSGLDMIQ